VKNWQGSKIDWTNGMHVFLKKDVEKLLCTILQIWVPS
jgi:hypothetical protein